MIHCGDPKKGTAEVRGMKEKTAREAIVSNVHRCEVGGRQVCVDRR